MSNNMTVHKWYWVWDFEKEEKWLNEMAMQGWTLASVGWCTYTFEKTEPDEYIIRLEMHGDTDASYVSFMEETGAEYIGRVMRWLYFRRKSELGSFDIFSDIDSKIAQLQQIAVLLLVLGLMNLLLGILNSFRSPQFSWMNIVVGSLLMYGLGRIHGMKEYLENERKLRE